MNATTDNRIVFATDVATGRARHVREVKTGLACGCICPGCQAPLEAVNAESLSYRRRPHFRHAERPFESSCADRSLEAGLREASASISRVSLPAATSEVGQIFPGLAHPTPGDIEISEFEVVDATTALLHVPDGRVLRVLLRARSWGDGVNPPGFDLAVTLPDEDTELQSIADLASHVALDPDQWRWCSRQTTPPGLDVPPAFQLDNPFLPGDDQVVAPAADAEPGSVGPDQAGPSGHRPVRSWTETVIIPGRQPLLFHRQIWPNGVMTEQHERPAS